MGRGPRTRIHPHRRGQEPGAALACRDRPSRPSRSPGARTRSRRCSISWWRTTASRAARYSACRRTMWRSRWCSPGSRSNNDSSGTSPEGILGEEHPHPRAYGTFPADLAQVRARRASPARSRMRSANSPPCRRSACGSPTAACLKRGLWADVVVFDPATVADRSTFSSPNQLAVGMRWVLVNGVPVIADGQMTGAKPGQVLRGPGYKRVRASGIDEPRRPDDPCAGRPRLWQEKLSERSYNCRFFGCAAARAALGRRADSLEKIFDYQPV